MKNYADIELGPVVGREEFTPPPKVDSQVIILGPHEVVVKEEVFKKDALESIEKINGFREKY